MQAPTHFLTGILIAKLVQLSTGILPIWFQLILIAICSFLSHIVVDCLAKVTYHPPDPHMDDPFWVIYHAIIFGLTLFFLLFFWKEFWFTMVFSVMIDIIDWGILRGLLKKAPFFHPMIDALREKSIVKKLPNLNHAKWTILIEFSLLSILLIVIYAF